MDALGRAATAVGIGSGIDQGGIGDHEPDVRRGPVETRIIVVGGLVVAAFADCAEAELVLEELRRAGHASDRLGLAMNNGVLIEQRGELAQANVADRGLFAALVELGVSEAEARRFARQFGSYCSIITVRATDQLDEVVELLERHRPVGSRRLSRPVDHRVGFLETKPDRGATVLPAAARRTVLTSNRRDHNL
jgi:hypothetical protein